MTETVGKITGLPRIHFGAKSSIGISCNSSDKALRQSQGHLVSCSHFVPNPSRSCNSSDTRIGLPGLSRAHRLARCFAGRTRRGSMIFAGRSPELPDDVCRKDTEDHRPARLHTGRTRTCLQNVFYFIVNQAAHFCNLLY